MNQTTGAGKVVLSVLFLLFLLGVGFAFLRNATPARRRWAMAIGAGAVGVLLLFTLLFYVRMESTQGARTATIQSASDYQAWKRNEVIRQVVPGPQPAPPVHDPRVLRPTPTIEPEAPPRKPAPASPSREWIATNGGSRRLSQSAGGLSVEIDIPGPNGELVGYSARLEPTEADALRAAQASLYEKLKGLLKLEIARNWGITLDKNLEAIVDDQVSRYLAQPSAEADRFEEQVQIQSAPDPMHRAAVLTLLPAGQVSRMASEASEIARTTQAQTVVVRRTWAWTVASGLVLGLFIYLIYSFINAGTKGHLAWPLRLVSIAAFLLLAGCLLLVRGHLS